MIFEWQQQDEQTNEPKADQHGTPSTSSKHVSPKKRKREAVEGEEEILTMNRLEHERRMDIMLKEHEAKMQIYALKKEILQSQIREQNADPF